MRHPVTTIPLADLIDADGDLRSYHTSRLEYAINRLKAHLADGIPVDRELAASFARQAARIEKAIRYDEGLLKLAQHVEAALDDGLPDTLREEFKGHVKQAKQRLPLYQEYLRFLWRAYAAAGGKIR
jgi:hypothetical protein